MQVMDLIDKLQDLNGGLEIAIGDLQYNCCDKNIEINDGYMIDDYGELYNKEDYDEEEWNEIKDDLKPIILIV